MSDHERIINLKHRDKITKSDEYFIKLMSEKYLIGDYCWTCPSDIRKAAYVLMDYVEKNKIEDESKTIEEQRPIEVGGASKSISRGSKSRKGSNGGK